MIQQKEKKKKLKNKELESKKASMTRRVGIIKAYKQQYQNDQLNAI